jgi:cellulose 1,4-beta-cellobiosidase
LTFFFSNYNGLGNQPQVGRDELVYINNLAPLLEARGFPAHFIVDQGRSGNQVAARDGGDWCNFSVSISFLVKTVSTCSANLIHQFAGFGPRPSTTTPSPYVSFVSYY